MIIMKKLFNIIKIIHRLVYCLLLPVGFFLLVLSHILYYCIIIFVPLITYIFKGDFNTKCIHNLEDDDNMIDRIFSKINNFIYPNYK